jgi:hypothetical protein
LPSAGLLMAFCGVAMAGTNGQKNPVNRLVEPGSFEVVNKYSHSDTYIWCSAAREARRMGATYQAKIYILSGLGPSLTSARDYGVVFTLQPDANLKAQSEKLGSTFTASLTKVGNYMSVTQGERLCVREIDN